MTIRTIEMRRGSEYPEPLLYFKLCIKECHYLIDVFVSPSGEVHYDYFVFWKALCKLDCISKSIEIEIVDHLIDFSL